MDAETNSTPTMSVAKRNKRPKDLVAECTARNALEQGKHKRKLESMEADEDRNDRRVRRFLSITIYVAAIVFSAILASICVGIVLNAAASPDDRKWATAILTATMTALVGYLIGQELPPPK